MGLAEEVALADHSPEFFGSHPSAPASLQVIASQQQYHNAEPRSEIDTKHNGIMSRSLPGQGGLLCRRGLTRKKDRMCFGERLCFV